MKTVIYKVEEDFNTFENIVKDNKSEAFFSIEKAIADAGEFHVIHLVSTNKKTLKELRVPLAYYIGTESDEALIEEELLIQEAIKRLYKALLNNGEKIQN